MEATGEPNRRRVAEALAAGERSAGEIAAAVVAAAVWGIASGPHKARRAALRA